ncbi:MAG: carboxypeptidase regulatory-like domain-containing protein [Planctomycetes bacterium]|nr:carboxypeptidase regulatory-like domain-containing protein [Planctomycetota bacterium]
MRAENGTPIAGAAITLQDVPEHFGDKRPERRAVDLRTDARGELQIAIDRRIDAIVRVPGCCVEAAEVPFDRNLPTAIVTIPLFPAASLAGRVVDEHGNPVAGAEVAAIGRYHREATAVSRGGCGNGYHAWNRDLGTTDAQGRYGPVTCYAGGIPAFEVAFEGRQVVLAGIELDPTLGPVFDVELRLPPRVELNVHVRTPDGRPARDDSLEAVVTREFDCFAPIESWGHFHSEGVATFALPAAGRHRLRLQAVSDDAVEEPAPAIELDLVVRHGTNDITVVLPWSVAQADASDAALDDESDDAGDTEEVDDEAAPPESEPGNLVGSIACECSEEEGCDSLRVRVLRDGVTIDAIDAPWNDEYEFDDLEPGAYVVVLDGAGHRPVESAPVVVEAHATTEVARLVAPAIGQVRGRLVDPLGRPLVGIDLALVGAADPEQERVHAETDESGRFRLPRLRDPAFLDVVDPGVGAVRMPFPDLAPTEWTIELPAPRRITGTIVTPLGVPRHWVTVRWGDASATAANPGGMVPPGERQTEEAAVAADGTFVIERASAGPCILEPRYSSFPLTNYVVARRLLPAGGDLDLGVWELPAVQ